MSTGKKKKKIPYWWEYLCKSHDFYWHTVLLVKLPLTYIHGVLWVSTNESPKPVHWFICTLRHMGRNHTWYKWHKICDQPRQQWGHLSLDSCSRTFSQKWPGQVTSLSRTSSCKGPRKVTSFPGPPAASDLNRSSATVPPTVFTLQLCLGVKGANVCKHKAQGVTCSKVRWFYMP